MTDHLAKYLHEVVAASPEGYVTYAHLSDEETAVIQDDDPSGLTVLPWIESQKNLDAASASLFGRRSLYLRGLLAIQTDPQTGESALAVTDQLRFVSDARRLGVGYVFAQATQYGERTARYDVLQAQIGAYEEDIDTDGFHHFSACTYRTALQRLAGWTLPPSGDGRQIRESVPARRWQRWASKELGPDVRTVEVNLALPDGNGALADSAWYTAHGNGAAVLGAPAGNAINVSTATPSQLEYALAEQISSALGVAF